MFPPTILKLTFQRPERDAFTVWFPIALVWVPVALLMLLVFPFIMIAVAATKQSRAIDAAAPSPR